MAGPTVPTSGEKLALGAKAASQGTNKIIVAVSVLNLLVSIGLGAVIFIGFQKEKNKPSIEDIAASIDRSGAEGHDAKAVSESESSKSKEGENNSEGATGSAGNQKKTARFGKMLNLEQFTINLASVSGVSPKFVRVNVSLEVADEDAEAEVNAKMPQVRNAIIDLFNSKKSADLSSVDGREAIKEDIKNALNGFMVNGKVSGVFFTSFAISS